MAGSPISSALRALGLVVMTAAAVAAADYFKPPNYHVTNFLIQSSFWEPVTAIEAFHYLDLMDPSDGPQWAETYDRYYGYFIVGLGRFHNWHEFHITGWTHYGPGGWGRWGSWTDHPELARYAPDGHLAWMLRLQVSLGEAPGSPPPALPVTPPNGPPECATCPCR
ncbi:MAG TPA: hypothetical protein VEL07_21855 [Planctomycetota bacterium]|nr:hypothetical protein [Planctomycetota bacterium]